MTEPLQAWTVQRFDADADHPEWEDDCHFRSQERAEAYAQQLNQEELDGINRRRKRDHGDRLRDIAEQRALVAAGLRNENSIRSDPGDFVLQTELERWDTRFRVVPLEFQDDVPQPSEENSPSE